MYDIFIIGGGPGGYVAAIRGAQLGLKVGLCEERWLGGTCTNVGCIPTKVLLYSSKLYSMIKDSEKFGIKVSDFSISYMDLMKRKDRVVTRLSKGIEYLLKKNRVDLFLERGKVLSKNKVLLEKSNLEVETKNLIIATGSSPIKFPPFNLDEILVSDDIFKLTEAPKSLIIIGGGVIGVEFGTFFSQIGTDVMIIEIMEHILPNEDEDLAEALRDNLTKKGVKIYESTTVESVEKKENGFKARLNIKGEIKEIEGEKILLSVGRKANINDDIKALGLNINKTGVVVDDRMRTNIDGVYAVGDVIGKYMLAHSAMREGIVATENIAGINSKMDFLNIPSVIYTDPEIAIIGKRENELKKEGKNYKVGVFPISASGKARTMEESEGFCKVIIDDKKENVLGVQIFSPHATDLIMEGLFMVKYEIPTHKLLEAIHPHPTISEIIIEALEAGLGHSIHI